MNNSVASRSGIQHLQQVPLFCRISDRIIDVLTRFFLGLAALCVLGALCVIAYSVVCRYLLNQPSLWVDEVVGYLVLGIVMFGCSAALREGRHIGVDLLTERLRGKWRTLATAWGHASVLAVAIFLVSNGWQTAQFSREMDIVSNGHLELPMFWLQMLMPLGGGMLALVSLDSLLRLACGLAPRTSTQGAH
ncbi:TRAP transporter small permease [Pseudomonas sp. LRF_L74]|uniref:TRAP transporter small permease n=1 Tax=Pseudomonas sp. LRF_L74 TaxID=3369422 RepID=UPI003F61EC85